MANTAAFEDSDVDERRSAYDSDDESLIDVDSPADGYFAHRDHPRETFVQNPLRESQEKAQEAARERQASRSVPATVESQSATASRPSVDFDESAPLLDAGPAPPDYYQATAGRTDLPRPYSHGHARDTSYGSISSPPPSRGHEQAPENVDGRPSRDPVPFSSDHPLVRNGLFGEQGVLNSRSQQPQSMRDPAQATTTPQPAEMTQNAVATTVPPVNHNVDQRPQEQRDEESGSEQLPSYHHDHHHHHHHDFKKQKRGWRRHFYCCCIPRLGCLNILLIFGLIVMFVLLTSAPHSDNRFGDPHSRLPIGKQPYTDLPLPDHPNTRQCSFDSRGTSMSKSFDFHNPGNFSFLEMMEDSSGIHSLSSGVRISGKIRVAPFPSSSMDEADNNKVAIRLWVHVASTQPLRITDLRYGKDEDGFELGFPKVRPTDDVLQGYERGCLDFAILIQVRRDVEIQNWDITTANLDVEVEKGIFDEDDPWSNLTDEEDEAETRMQRSDSDGLSITNESTLYTLRGSISVAYWSSRRTRVSTHSSSIHGTYALRDSLEVESKSGSIDIGVEPKKAASEDPSDAPADLTVKSKSGSINVEFPARHDEYQAVIPERQYRTRVETQSSTVSGRYLLGVSTLINTQSGTIDAYILPLSANLWNSSLRTETKSATTSLVLLDAISAVPFATGAGSIDPEPPHLSRWNMGSIASVHKSNSGSLNIKYPSHWAGFIEGRTTSGSINVEGEDVEIITDVTGPGFHRLAARKGIGGSLMSFRTSSGSVDILVGET